ncbi:hypothetical protein DE4576_02293 [Mycobacterium marinum]|nr:hypothetical protein MMMB2_2926 [Mycobacterium marinum MB2]RFZ66944.1 hypothetical protein DE4576_02293 [Mycobacterium marinum]
MEPEDRMQLAYRFGMSADRLARHRPPVGAMIGSRKRERVQ